MGLVGGDKCITFGDSVFDVTEAIYITASAGSVAQCHTEFSIGTWVASLRQNGISRLHVPQTTTARYRPAIAFERRLACPRSQKSNHPVCPQRMGPQRRASSGYRQIDCTDSRRSSVAGDYRGVGPLR